MAKRPAYQWYPGDFRRDTGVQTCTFEARALWREMLDLMHDGQPRGYLNAGGAPITPEALSRIIGIPVAKVKRWLDELEQHHVFSRTEEGVIYSRRMVRDEQVAAARAAGGGLSLTNPNVPRPRKGAIKPTRKDTSKDTFTHSLDTSFGGSPAVAVAVASAVPTSPDGENPGLSEANSEKPPSWPAEGAELWTSKVGPIPVPRFGRTMKPMVDQYGWEKSRAAMLAYIELTDGRTRKVEWLVADAVKWVALGEMPLVDPETGNLTERGEIVAKQARRAAS